VRTHVFVSDISITFWVVPLRFLFLGPQIAASASFGSHEICRPVISGRGEGLRSGNRGVAHKRRRKLLKYACDSPWPLSWASFARRSIGSIEATCRECPRDCPPDTHFGHVNGIGIGLPLLRFAFVVFETARIWLRYWNWLGRWLHYYNVGVPVRNSIINAFGFQDALAYEYKSAACAKAEWGV